MAHSLWKYAVPNAGVRHLLQGIFSLSLCAAAWISCRPEEPQDDGSTGAASAAVPQEVHQDVSSTEVATGVIHHEVHLVAGPWWIHVLEIDLPRAWKAGIRLRTVNAPGGGLEKTSALAARSLAAINGDFYFKQQEVFKIAGLQIRSGCLLQQPQGRSAFAITRDGVPVIGLFRLEAGLIAGGSQVLPIAGFDHEPGAATLSVFNYFSQDYRDSVHAAIGFQLQGLDGKSAINDTVSARVMQVRRRAWPLLLEQGQWLVAAGEEYPHADRIAPGDTVALFLKLLPVEGRDEVIGQLVEAIGGGPRILRDGRVSVEYTEERLGQSFAEERHPRTALGYSQDGRTLFLVVVDGRQPGYSVGMSLGELAEFMRTQLSRFGRTGRNAHQALNLDGGGSTTMVVGQQVVNSPSDQTGERAVANALLVVQDAVDSR